MTRYEGPIEVGMILTAPDRNGELGFRRVRVLAAHPDGGWIIEELPSRMIRSPTGLGRCPDENLRIVFEPEESILVPEEVWGGWDDL